MRRLKVSRWTRFKSSDNSVLNSYAISAAIHWKMRSSLRRIGCLDPAFACFQPSIAIVILIATRCYESQTVLRDEADTGATWWISYVTKPYDARSKGRDHTKECSSPPLSRRLRVLRGFLPPMWRFFFSIYVKGNMLICCRSYAVMFSVVSRIRAPVLIRGNNSELQLFPDSEKNVSVVCFWWLSA